MSNWNKCLNRLVAGQDLNRLEAKWLMEQIMLGDAGHAQLGAILALLSAKTETAEEIEGFAEGMLQHAVPFEVPGRLLDIVGTGGDQVGSVNISSMAAVVIAACGIKVLKHGNKAVSSLSGSADVLGELGVNLNLQPDGVAATANEAGISFAFATTFHPAMRHAAPIRKELGIHTVFNLLGPLTNPSHPDTVVIGVANVKYARLVAEVFASRGEEGFVFNGKDENGRGLDELAATAHGTLFEIRQVRDADGTKRGIIEETTFDPARLRDTVGLEKIEIDDLKGGDAKHNAQVARRLFDGVGAQPSDTKQERAIFQTVCLNAAAGIVADATLIPDGLLEHANTFENLMERFEFGFNLAKEAIISGKAKEKLEKWIKVSNQH
ncbi:MAG: anthranilate phosphoribosyltransferase [Candidatus Ancillula sp.]|jgi:anthranilate phosphoribosyltransferase|nr:anthranilate phosphoribosyltransferase [Candidatus Ancillula sp.]